MIPSFIDLGIGNIITMVGGIISVAFVYGGLSEKIKNQQKQIDVLFKELEKQEEINKGIYRIEAKLDTFLNNHFSPQKLNQNGSRYQ